MHTIPLQHPSVYVHASILCICLPHQMHGCNKPSYPGNCSAEIVYSAIFFCIHAVCLLISAALCWQLLWNMKVEVRAQLGYHKCIKVY